MLVIALIRQARYGALTTRYNVTLMRGWSVSPLSPVWIRLPPSSRFFRHQSAGVCVLAG
mgnify:CR=1 FL=1